jgi:hypothetical protein
MRPFWPERPTHVSRVAATAGALALVSSAALAATSAATLVRAAHTASAPKPSAEITGRRMRPRTGFPTPTFGIVIPASDLFGNRVFTNSQIGFALENDGNEQFPARTINGGQSWKIDGPQVHVDAADGAEAVAYVGIISPNVEFAYGGSVVDVSTNAGHTWWEAFLVGNVTAVVPGRQGLLAFVQQSVSSKHPNPIVTWQYVSTDGGKHWHYSTSFAASA